PAVAILLFEDADLVDRKRRIPFGYVRPKCGLQQMANDVQLLLWNRTGQRHVKSELVEHERISPAITICPFPFGQLLWGAALAIVLRRWATKMIEPADNIASEFEQARRRLTRHKRGEAANACDAQHTKID